MDLGSLELQIFVSLTVVLGGAFVALVCDYLKGNNEQLREHNIELRVRKEEQERRLLLDPAGFLGQWLPGNTANRNTVPTASQSNGRTVSAHEVMQSFAAPEALKEAESRAAKFHSRGGEESYDSADVPPLTQRRSGRIRAARKGTRDGRTNGESYGDWVRPEVIARVARRSEAAAAYSSDIRDELDSTREEVRPEPLNAASNWDIREQLPAREKQPRPAAEAAPVNPAPVPTPAAVASSAVPPAAVEPEKEPVPAESRMNADEASRLQREIERVSQMERQPAAPAPGTILRPLTVPSLSLREEIQRVAEAPSVSLALPAVWHSPLLDEVIAASGTRSRTTPKTAVFETAEEEIETPQPVAVVEPEIKTVAAAVEMAKPLPVVSVAEEAQQELGVQPAESPTPPIVSREESVAIVAETPAVEEETVEARGFTFITDEEADLIVIEPPVVAEETVAQAAAVEIIEPLPFAVSEEASPSDAVEGVEAYPFTFITDEDSALVVAETPVAAEAIEPPRFTFVTDEESALMATETPVAVEETVVFSDAVENVAPPSFTFNTEEESAPITVEAPVIAEETVASKEAIEVAEPSPFNFLADEESAPIVAETPVVAEEFVLRGEVVESVEPPPFAFTTAEESASIALETPLSAEDADLVPVVVETPVAIEEIEFRSEAAESLEPAPFTFFTDEVSVPVVVETPVVAEQTVALSEAVETAEPPLFTFFTDEESAPIVAEAPVVAEETVALSEAVEAVELTPFTFIANEESAPIVPETPVAIEGIEFQREAAQFVEPPPFLFVADEESTPVFDDAPVFARETAEPIVSASLVAAEQTDSQCEVVEAIEPPPFVFVTDEVFEPLTVNIQSPEVEPPPFAFIADEETVPAVVETPVAIEGAILQRESADGLDSPPITYGMDEESIPLTFEAPAHVTETVSQTDIAPPFVFSFEEPASDLKFEPQPFTFVMNVEPELAELAVQQPAAAADVPEISAGTGPTVDAPIEADLRQFWLGSPIATTEAEDRDYLPMANFDDYTFGPRISPLSGMGVTPAVDYLPTLPAIEKPASALSLSEEPALAFPAPSVDSDLVSLPALLPLYSDLDWEPASAPAASLAVETTVSEPPPFWGDTVPESNGSMALTPPIDISMARQSEPAPVEPPAGNVPDLLLPTGMHDVSTWTRLLSLPNPMTGILFVITLQPSDAEPAPDRKGAIPPPDNGPAIEKLMASFVREGDFGTRIAENEWIFIYNHDVAGFNQRRVGMISEKLWDFQLRHLGMANVRFKWGAVDVKSEGLGEAVQAARDRMNQTRRSRKLPGADQTSSRRVVNA